MASENGEIVSPDDPDQDNGTKLLNYCTAIGSGQVLLQHQDGRIRVWWHPGERTLVPCIRHRHTGSSPSVMKNNARKHVVSVGLSFLDTGSVRLWLFPARSPYQSPVEDIYSMVSKRLAGLHTLVSTIVDLLHRVEAT
ncbi:hypothetical protein TNCV_4760821 [Trichonephila clavipes]|uniref:Uncharacterized protein n=1 Tax=Trichonephila clavipes TaxID=2585209 RepID=A0A8X6RDW4_TRICX|nr:hypothetical protein TNCV_4760821 [Trichonephila clavipes]